MDITARVTQTLNRRIVAELARLIVDDFVDGRPSGIECDRPICRECDRIFECTKRLKLPGDLITDMALLADLEHGHIKWVRD